MRTFSVAAVLLGTLVTLTVGLPAVTFAQSPETKRERIGTVLGKAVYRDELPKNPTYSDAIELFIAPVMNEFHQLHRQEYDLTDDEIRSAEEWRTARVKNEGGDRWKEWTDEGERRRQA